MGPPQLSLSTMGPKSSKFARPLPSVSTNRAHRSSTVLIRFCFVVVHWRNVVNRG